jgi:transcriptional regulator with XRE-family HTH domain
LDDEASTGPGRRARKAVSATALDLESVLAREIRRHRDRHGWTAAELAERVTAVGGKMPRQVISKIETGVRDVSIPELLIVGRALRVPPLMLLFPVGRHQEIEFPNDARAETQNTWGLLRWCSGEARLDGGDISEDPGAAPLVLYRRHQALVDEWASGARLLYTTPMTLDTEKLRRDAERRSASAVTELRNCRAEMSRLGLSHPDLPPGIREQIEPHPFEGMPEDARWVADAAQRTDAYATQKRAYQSAGIDLAEDDQARARLTNLHGLAYEARRVVRALGGTPEPLPPGCEELDEPPAREEE